MGYLLYFQIMALLIVVVSCQCLEVTRQILITTDTVSQITITSAVLSGDIKDMGDGVVQYGYYWGIDSQQNFDSRIE